jgi:hypothetical protein
MIDTQNTTSPAVTDAAIDAETNRIIAATCVKHGIQPSDLPPGAADDARRAAREMIESEARKDSNEYFHLYNQEKQARETAEATLKAVRENRNIAANTADHRHTVTAERARALMGNEQWFMCTADQRIQAVDVDPKSVDKVQLRALFGRGHSTADAVDFAKANPRRYAALREAAKAIGVYGA